MSPTDTVPTRHCCPSLNDPPWGWGEGKGSLVVKAVGFQIGEPWFRFSQLCGLSLMALTFLASKGGLVHLHMVSGQWTKADVTLTMKSPPPCHAMTVTACGVRLLVWQTGAHLLDLLSDTAWLLVVLRSGCASLLFLTLKMCFVSVICMSIWPA